MERFGDTEIIKWIRELLPVIVLLIVLTSAVEAYFIKTNSDTISNLIAQNTALHVQNQQTSSEFNTFLKAFTAEANYECRVLWYMNHGNSTVPVAPPLSICQVAAP